MKPSTQHGLDGIGCFESAFEFVSVGLAIVSLDGAVLQANPRLCEIFGYRKEEMVTKTWQEVTPQEELDADLQLIARLLAAEMESYARDKRFRRKDSCEFWGHLKVRLVRDSRGTPEYFVCFVEDITERKQSERSLVESEKRYRSLFENMSAGFVLFEVVQDDQGIPVDLVLLAANEKFEKTTGLKASEVTGKRLKQVLPGIEKDTVDWIGTYGQVALTGVPRQFDQGSELLGTFYSVTAYQAGPRQCGVTFQDITDRKRSEAELTTYRLHLEEMVNARTAELMVAKEAAETANKTKSAFLANMSHEIRTPLHAIAGLAHLMRKSGITAEQTERLDRINAASTHLLGIINDILDLSKIEADKIRVEEAPLTIGNVVDSVHSMIAEAAVAKNLAIRIADHSVPGHLLGDSTRLKQALLNYASNAVKFTEHGGITLDATIAEEVADSVLMRFEVRDTGIGIAPDVLRTLFASFVQADGSATRRYGGTGLGLVITRKIAELMGGTAGATSTPGTGSTFWFTARLKKTTGSMPAIEQRATDPPEKVLKRNYGQLRILVADDDPDNRYITQHLLQEVWPQIDLAEDGARAVELAGKNSYDVMLIDLQMPRMDGLEVARRIRRLPGGKDILILALTANVFPENRQECLDAGMDELIPKAIKVEAPFEMILNGLRQRDKR